MNERLFADLDERLRVMRRYGQNDMLLVARALSPEHVRWAEDNGVEARQHAHVAPGVLYLCNRAGLSPLTPPAAVPSVQPGEAK